MPERSGMVLRRREHANRQFVHTCSVKRYVKSASPVAGESPVRTLQNHLSGQACYYYTLSSVEDRLETGPVFTRRKGKIQFPIGADIKAGDVITIVTDQLGVQRNTSSMAIDGDPIILDTHIEIEVSEIGGV